jgi:Putative transposase DNA-binding domain
MPLWIRTYRCKNCGLVMDRDENSAVNIYQRFIARLGPRTQLECGVLHERAVIKTLHVLKSRVDVVAVQFSTGGKLEEIRVYQHAVTADSQ